MNRYAICLDVFPELETRENIELFKKFLKAEFLPYTDDGRYLLAHNEGDSHWFTQQFIEAKKGKGLYADFFKNTNNCPVS
jgi:hypothetical protein